VRLAFDKETCQKYAVKSISKKTFSVGVRVGGTQVLSQRRPVSV